MKNKSRLLTTIVALATVAIGLTGCSSDSGADDDTVVFRSAYLPTANYLTTVRTTGVLEDELAKVGATAEHIGPLDPIEAYNTVTSGNADASSTGTGYFVNLAANDSEWVAFALEKYTGDSQGIVAAPGTGIDSLEDLYGKKIGIDNPGATGDYLVHQAFANAGLDVSRVELVSLAPGDFAAAFGSGQIDALASFDQNLANAVATPGAKLLVTGDRSVPTTGRSTSRVASSPRNIRRRWPRCTADWSENPSGHKPIRRSSPMRTRSSVPVTRLSRSSPASRRRRSCRWTPPRSRTSTRSPSSTWSSDSSTRRPRSATTS